MIETNNLRGFAKVFSASYLIDMMNGRKLNHFKGIYNTSGIQNGNDISIKDILNIYYKNMLDNYRNEYVYKNKLFETIKKNERANTYSLISEMETGIGSRVDMALFSSSSHAYEIKTELDSLYRLDKQLNDYSKAFEFVWTITSENKVEKLVSKLDTSVGIQYLNDDNKLIILRDATSNLEQITHAGLFTLLRQNEFIKIIKMYHGHAPFDGTYESRKNLIEMFKEINVHEAHESAVSLLKNRMLHRKLSLFLENAPISLFAIGLNQVVQKETKRFLNFLDSRINELDNHIDMMQHGKLF